MTTTTPTPAEMEGGGQTQKKCGPEGGAGEGPKGWGPEGWAQTVRPPFSPVLGWVCSLGLGFFWPKH